MTSSFIVSIAAILVHPIHIPSILNKTCIQYLQKPLLQSPIPLLPLLLLLSPLITPLTFALSLLLPLFDNPRRLYVPPPFTTLRSGRISHPPPRVPQTLVDKRGGDVTGKSNP